MKLGQIPGAKYVGFFLWYADGTTVKGRTFADWIAAPQDGLEVVQVCVDRLHLDRRTVPPTPRHFTARLALKDYYWMTPDGDFGYAALHDMDIHGNLPPPEAVVKRGRTISDEAWLEVYNATQEDPPFGTFL